MTFWLSKHGLKDEQSRYKSQMYELNRSLSLENFRSKVAAFGGEWDTQFSKYFSKNIEPAFLNNFEKLEDKEFEHFRGKNITSNVSESLHSSIKKFIHKHRNIRVDELALDLFIYQNNFLHECNRARGRYGGDNKIKSEFMHISKEIDLKYTDLSSKDIMLEVCENIERFHRDELAEENDNLTEKALAWFAIRDNLIQISFESYFVRHPFIKLNVQQVVIQDGKFLSN